MKLSGWQRLWVLITILYFFPVAFCTYYIYGFPTKSKIVEEREWNIGNIFNLPVSKGKIIKSFPVQTEQEAQMEQDTDISIIWEKIEQDILKKSKPMSPGELLLLDLRLLRLKNQNIPPKILAEKIQRIAQESYKKKEITTEELDYITLDSELKLIEEKYMKDLNALLIKQIETIGLGLLLWIIPMGLLYGSGLAIKWVIAGFKQLN